jgi:pimeloyl-ACP methyl ester carboxylesterase
MAEAEQLEARFRASHLKLVAARDRLQAAVEAGTASDHDQTRLGTVQELLTPVSVAELDASGNVVEVQRFRQFYQVDPEGRGRAVEVLGDLRQARNVAVLVPGMGNNLETFRGQSDRGDLIRHEAGPGTAVVVWLDYESPEGIREAMSKTPAEAGGPRLATFMAELDELKLPAAKVTLVGHSYGTDVVGQGLLHGAHPDRVVLTGSPGITKYVDEATDLVPPPTRLYVERAPGDYVSYTQWHGPDPASFPDAIRMATNDQLANDEAVSVHWHNEYYRPNSEALRNIGRVVRGDLASITTTDTTRAQETKLMLGASWGDGLKTLAGAASKVYDGVVSLTKPSRAAIGQDGARSDGAGTRVGQDGARTPSGPVAPTHSRRPGGPAR